MMYYNHETIDKTEWLSRVTTESAVCQKLALLVGLVMIVAPWMHHSGFNYDVGILEDLVTELNLERAKSTQLLEKEIHAFKTINNQIQKLDEENSAMHSLIKQQGGGYSKLHTVLSDNEQASYVYGKEQEHDEDAYLMRIESLEQDIKYASRRSIERRYRSIDKTMQVQVQLKEDILRNSIVRDINPQLSGDTFVIEMGSVDTYGHAINVFLYLADYEHYYDDLKFVHRTAEDTIIHTMPRHHSKGRSLIDALDPNKTHTETSLRQVILSEQPSGRRVKGQSSTIDKFSVCFMDKGPQFYIKMSTEANLDEVRRKETCFGKVTEGRAILEYIVRNHTRASKHNMEPKFSTFGIKSVRTVSHNTTTITF